MCADDGKVEDDEASLLESGEVKGDKPLAVGKGPGMCGCFTLAYYKQVRTDVVMGLWFYESMGSQAGLSTCVALSHGFRALGGDVEDEDGEAHVEGHAEQVAAALCGASACC